MTEIAPLQTHTVSGLIKLRADRAGRIIASQEQLEQDYAELSAIDAVLKVLAPDFKPESIKPKRGRAPRQRITDLLLSALRTADQPLNAQAAALKVIAARGQSIDDAKLVKQTTQRVHTTLQNLRRKKVVEAVVGSRPQAWRVAA